MIICYVIRLYIFTLVLTVTSFVDVCEADEYLRTEDEDMAIDKEQLTLNYSMDMARPRLIVFDLDYTLWPFWVDTHIRSPIQKDKNNQVVDGSGKEVKPYTEVPEVLEELKSDGYTLGIASRTEWPEGARQLLKLFDWNKYFTYKEIYPGKKTTHFRKMHEASGIPYSDMMFFDDEMRNINDLKAVGVYSILVPDGVNKQIMKESLDAFKHK